MLAPTSGLARITIRAPRRRLDLSLPHQVPLAELLPEVLRRAGETGGHEGLEPDAGGWILRRADGTSLTGEVALAAQGVRDGDVLYLVPRNLTWPEPGYDDVVEEIAAGARSHGRTWDAAATRVFALVAAGLLLLGGLGLLFRSGTGVGSGLAAGAVAVVLLLVGSLLSRAAGDAIAGSAGAGFAVPYAAAAGVLLAGGGTGPAGRGIGAAGLLVGASALLLASVLGAVAVGDGPRVFVAGGTVGLFAAVGALIGLAVSAAGAAAIVVVVQVAGIGLAPLLAVRLGKLPLPAVTSAPELLAAERRPGRAAVLASVVRADEILAGSLLGIAITTVGCVALLARTGGTAGILLGGLAASALLLRSRLFPSLAARLPLLVSGVVGLAGVAWIALSGLGGPAGLVGAALAVIAVLVLLGTAATAHRRRPGGSPYLSRMADILDIATVVALAPVACAVLNLYEWVRGLAG